MISKPAALITGMVKRLKLELVAAQVPPLYRVQVQSAMPMMKRERVGLQVELHQPATGGGGALLLAVGGEMLVVVVVEGVHSILVWLMRLRYSIKDIGTCRRS